VRTHNAPLALEATITKNFWLPDYKFLDTFLRSMCQKWDIHLISAILDCPEQLQTSFIGSRAIKNSARILAQLADRWMPASSEGLIPDHDKQLLRRQCCAISD
jgi:hypothetical protein